MSPVLEKANCLGSVLNYPFPLFTGKTGLIEITRKAIFTVAYSPVMSCVTLPAAWLKSQDELGSEKSHYGVFALLLFSKKAFRLGALITSPYNLICHTCTTEAGVAALFIPFSTACLFSANIMWLLKLQTIQYVVNQQTDARR